MKYLSRLKKNDWVDMAALFVLGLVAWSAIQYMGGL